jgi:hypothetical protein
MLHAYKGGQGRPSFWPCHGSIISSAKAGADSLTEGTIGRCSQTCHRVSGGSSEHERECNQRKHKLNQFRATLTFFVRPHVLHASESSSNAPPNRIGVIRITAISVPHFGHVHKALSGGASRSATWRPLTRDCSDLSQSIGKTQSVEGFHRNKDGRPFAAPVTGREHFICQALRTDDVQDHLQIEALS